MYDDNEQLQKQVTALEHHLQSIEEQRTKEKETCPEGGDVSNIVYSIRSSIQKAFLYF